MKVKYLMFIILLCNLSITTAQTTNDNGWQWQYPKPQGNTLNGIYVFSKDTAVAVGDLSTVIKTTDGGVNWNVQHHAGGTSSGLRNVYFIDPMNGWAAGGDLLKTIDGGKSWSLVTLDSNYYCNAVYFVDADTGIVVGGDGYVSRTTDGGKSWLSEKMDYYISAYLDIYGLTAITFTDKQTGYIVGAGYYGNEIYKTTDCGRTWQWNEWALKPKVYGLSDISFINKEDGFIAVDTYVLKTTDGGATWQKDSVGNYNNNSVFFTDSLNGYVVGMGADHPYIYRTTDGGESWMKYSSSVMTEDALFKVRFADKSNGWAVGGTGIIYRTTDGGSNWISQREKNYNFNSIYFTDENTGWAVGDSGIILHTTDGGDNWEQQNKNDSLLFNSVYAVDDLNVFAVGLIVKGTWPSVGAIIFHSINGGQTWLKASFDTLGSFNSIIFINKSIGFITGDKGRVLKTSDGGNDWSLIYKDTISSNPFYTIQFINDKIGWVIRGVTNQVLKSTDGGYDWNSQEIGSGIWLRSLFFISENTGWAVGEDQGNNTYKTTDGGKTWIAEYTPFHCNLSSAYFINPDTGWAGGYDYNYNGVLFKTTDGGNNWIEQQCPTENELTSIYFVDPNTGWASGFGGIIKTTNGGGIMSVKNEDYYKNNEPKQIELYQNYPNPFNPTTKIEYSLPVESHVKLEIFDVLGRKILVLVNKDQKAGKHSAIFNGVNLASGIYFYRLSVGNFTETKKLVLVK